MPRKPVSDPKRYKQALQADKVQTIAYYNKSLRRKTEQQKFLEKLLDREDRRFKRIADIGCGGSSLSCHLNQKYPRATFASVDYNETAIELARKSNPVLRFCFFQDSINDLPSLPDNSFDLVCCWQTLSWLEESRKALDLLLGVTRKGGMIFRSSLFNTGKDVDLYTKLLDHTRKSGSQGMAFNYNPYSQRTIGQLFNGRAKRFEIVPFDPEIDFDYSGQGIGTSTVQTRAGRRLQLSAGMLLIWGVLVIENEDLYRWCVCVGGNAGSS